MSDQGCRIGRTYRARKVQAGPVRTRKAFELDYNPEHADVLWSGHATVYDYTRFGFRHSGIVVSGFVSHSKAQDHEEHS